MTGLEIALLDVDDDEAFEAWHRAYEEAERACGPDVAATWQPEEVRAMMRRKGLRFWDGGYSGSVAGRVVTTGWVRLPLLDNTDRAELAVHTVPDARRRGYATTMLDHLEGSRATAVARPCPARAPGRTPPGRPGQASRVRSSRGRRATTSRSVT